MFSHYGKLSTELYDHTKPLGQSINGDIDYYLNRLKNVDGRVLEAGVGSGRCLIPLLEKGLIVDGIDYSPDMLQSCRNRCQQRELTPELYEMRLEDFTLPHQYQAIIMPTGTFCLIESREKAVMVLENFKQHLASGGRIIVDLLLPYDFKEGASTTEVFSLPNGEGMTLESKSVHINWVVQRTTTLLKYEKWRAGHLLATELQELQLSWYGVEEFTLLLKELGYQNIICSSNYVHGRYPTDPDEIITFEAEVR
ncbi:class I SAM-dependent methyltransferase [Bacillus sp. SD088]|uniref:class I SAM-dependent methyltransferase n=1 Tax=Bacillus sp. SD088 TaxID=2782012 RepID=UPI001A97BE43|nr:class I SAM-dependent methyltransferase [Bacillus sp. SD088]MBO0995888.1 class I SAM-dependent methyltransferase [Bacillus sp. SD088]